jgi:hypothetical protein
MATPELTNSEYCFSVQISTSPLPESSDLIYEVLSINGFLYNRLYSLIYYSLPSPARSPITWCIRADESQLSTRNAGSEICTLGFEDKTR